MNTKIETKKYLNATKIKSKPTTKNMGIQGYNDRQLALEEQDDYVISLNNESNSIPYDDSPEW